MKKIPVGFDLRYTTIEISKAIKQIEESGLIKAGFETIVFSREQLEKGAANMGIYVGSFIREQINAIHQVGAKAGLAADIAFCTEHLKEIEAFDYLELPYGEESTDAFSALSEKLQTIAPDLFITVVTENRYVKEGMGADAWRIDGPLTNDFFDFTRNVLDSCLGTGAADCNDYPSACKERAHLSFFSKMYCIPALLPVLPAFDPERLKAILTMYGIMQSPVFLTTLPLEMTRGQMDILKHPVWQMVLKDTGRPGGQLRYYDPWHGLYKRTALDGRKWLFILNRCHGNTPNPLLSRDFDLPEGSEFEIRDLYDLSVKKSTGGVYTEEVDTSDHPETPCCKLYELC